MKILFAEDETDLRDVVSAYLEYQGYLVDAVGNGREALAKACSDSYDTIVMDVMMPEMDGITAMRRIRDTGNTTPALFLTAKGEVTDRVKGLDAGADDYLIKPFAMEELSARLRALGRRKRDYHARTLTFGNLELDTETAEIQAQNTIGLSHKEVRLLSCLMANSGRDLSADELLEDVWIDEPANTDTVWMYVSYLRAKLQSIQANVVIAGDRGHSFRLKEI